MRLFRFWSKATADVDAAQPWPVSCFGASNESVEDAARDAHARVRRIVEAVRRGEKLGAYAYADRPLREEIVEEFRPRDVVSAILSRNSYGSIVLNTARIFFADIDLPEARPAGFLARLFGRSTPDDTATQIIDRVDSVARQYRLAARLYKTAAGYRVLVTDQLLGSGDSTAHTLLEKLGSDPLYIQLCQIQESFRARLTPKYWRCGASEPPSRFPFMSEEEESKYRVWEREYATSIKEFATCELVKVIGHEVHDEVKPMIQLHDDWTLKAGATLA